MNKIMLVFFAVSLINVILNTAKSLFTVKGGIVSATIINTITFGFYTYVIVLTANADFSTNMKAIITMAANIIGVALVKFVEYKMKKDILWVFNATCKENNETIETIAKALKDMNIKLLYNEIVKDELYSMQIFSNTQNESDMITTILKNYNIHYHAYKTEQY